MPTPKSAPEVTMDWALKTSSRAASEVAFVAAKKADENANVALNLVHQLRRKVDLLGDKMECEDTMERGPVWISQRLRSGTRILLVRGVFVGYLATIYRYNKQSHGTHRNNRDTYTYIIILRSFDGKIMDYAVPSRNFFRVISNQEYKQAKAFQAQFSQTQELFWRSVQFGLVKRRLAKYRRNKDRLYLLFWIVNNRLKRYLDARSKWIVTRSLGHFVPSTINVVVVTFKRKGSSRTSFKECVVRSIRVHPNVKVLDFARFLKRKGYFEISQKSRRHCGTFYGRQYEMADMLVRVRPRGTFFEVDVPRVKDPVLIYANGAAALHVLRSDMSAKALNKFNDRTLWNAGVRNGDILDIRYVLVDATRYLLNRTALPWKQFTCPFDLKGCQESSDHLCVDKNEYHDGIRPSKLRCWTEACLFE